MDFDGSDVTNNQEFLSEEEKKAKLLELLSKPLSEVNVMGNIQFLCWGARQCLRPTSGERGGMANFPLSPQDLIAQDVPNKLMRKGDVYEAIKMIRDPKKLDLINSIGAIKTKDLPDGMYKDINIFFGDRSQFLTEEQKNIWQKKNITTADEGLAIHPIFNENSFLEGIKIFWHGHRNDLIVRTVTIEEINTSLKNNSHVDLTDCQPVRK
jgi:hypothetical protein